VQTPSISVLAEKVIDTSSAGCEILHPSLKPKVYYNLRKSQPLVSVLG
jgi:hypothetical protein